MKISCVVPCYNEEGSLAQLFARLTTVLCSLCNDYEIIFVDDGSTDKTPQILNIIQRDSPMVGIQTSPVQCGMSRALAVGFKNASGDVIITIDADLQYYPEDIPLLLAKLNSYDMVIGYRTRRHDPLRKKIPARIANKVRNWVLHERIHDAGCGLRAFKKECLPGIERYPDLFVEFLATLFLLKGYKVGEVPIRHARRLYGKSKFLLRNRIIDNSKKLLFIWRMKRRCRTQIPGR